MKLPFFPLFAGCVSMGLGMGFVYSGLLVWGVVGLGGAVYCWAVAWRYREGGMSRITSSLPGAAVEGVVGVGSVTHSISRPGRASGTGRLLDAGRCHCYSRCDCEVIQRPHQLLDHWVLEP